MQFNAGVLHKSPPHMFGTCLELILRHGKGQYAAVQSMVYASIDKTTDDAAGNHKQHGIKCHTGIHRLRVESRVKEDQHRAADADDDVVAKPGQHGAHAPEDLEAFAHRIDQQAQDGQTTAQSQVVAKRRSCLVGFGNPDLPADNDEYAGEHSQHNAQSRLENAV